MTAVKVNLLDFDRKGMRKFFAEELEEKAFRADQIMSGSIISAVMTLIR